MGNGKGWGNVGAESGTEWSRVGIRCGVRHRVGAGEGSDVGSDTCRVGTRAASDMGPGTGCGQGRHGQKTCSETIRSPAKADSMRFRFFNKIINDHFVCSLYVAP